MTKVISIMPFGLSMSVISNADEVRDEMMDLQIFRDNGKVALQNHGKDLDKSVLRRHLKLQKKSLSFRKPKILKLKL